MKAPESRSQAWAWVGSALLLGTSALAAASCTSVIGGTGVGSMAAGGTASGGAGTAAGGASANAGSSPTTDCTAPKAPAQRLVRLTYAQLENSIEALLGPDALKGITSEDPRQREFQALFAEGDLINTQVLQKTVSIGETASGALTTGFDSITGCASATTDDACASKFLLAFAEKAYRRPLVDDEKASLTQLYSDAKGIEGTVRDATRYALMGILTAPEALYRTELGTANGDGKTATLTGYEVASSLSYFLTNGPPDSGLLAAAAAGTLKDEAGIGAQIDRLLQSDAVKQNLTQVMIAYYGLKALDQTVKDTQVFPDFNVGVRNSMYNETQLFVDDVLWHGKVSDLMTSRKTFINDTLAKFYGVTYPATTGSAFLPFEFPDKQRAGILTHGSILTARARTDTTSVVARGLFVNGTVLCVQSPPAPPAAVQAQVDAQLADKTATERDKAHYRDTTSPCKGCHLGFDPYGLVLENYDGIGRLRTAYANGSAIDTSVALPPAAGGETVPDVYSFVQKVTESGAFSKCLTSNLMKYALADATLVDVDDCNVKQTHDAFQAGDGSFTNLIRRVAGSNLMTTRSIESTP